MTIILASIVKNEMAVLPRLFESALPHVDKAVILDTGSTDDTYEWLQAEHAMPVETAQVGWVDFAHNRNELLDSALTGDRRDWLLLLDADMTVEGTLLDLADVAPEVDVLMVEMVGMGVAYWLPLLVRGDAKVHFEGALHEALVGGTRAQLSSLRIQTHQDGGARRTPESDIALLQKQIADGGGEARTFFYLAQSYGMLGNATAAYENYRTAANLSLWGEEKCVALTRAAVIAYERGDEVGALGLLPAAWQANPLSAEPLHLLAYIHRGRGEYDLAALYIDRAVQIDKPVGGLFVEPSIYDWRVEFEWIDSMWRRHLGVSTEVETLLKNEGLPPEYRAHMEMILTDLSRT